MSTKPFLTVFGISLFSAVLASETALATPTDANYYVRPVLRVGSGEIQDGYQANGPTQATQTQNVAGSSRSTVNLADGTVKMSAGESSAQVGLQTFGGFGERLFINNGRGTNWDMNFTLDGEVFGNLEFVTPGSSNPGFFYDLSITVFNAGIANAFNFNGIANDPCWGQPPESCTPAPAPLARVYQSEYVAIDVNSGLDDFYEYVFKDISASVYLESDNEVLDLFVFTNVYVLTSPGDGLADYFADFTHTAAFGQQFADGVDVYSSSGEFMGLGALPPPSGVPAPGALSLLGLALAGLGYSRRKKA